MYVKKLIVDHIDRLKVNYLYKDNINYLQKVLKSDNYKIILNTNYMNDIEYIIQQLTINHLCKLFIDGESGLSFIKPTSSFIDYINLHGFIIPLFDYSILGQYNLSNIFGIKFDTEQYKYDMSECKRLIEENQYTILTTNKNKYHSRDHFKWIPFKKIIKSDEQTYTDFFVIQFVLGKFRIIYFDDNGYHMSNPDFNKTKLSIDNLYDNLIDIFIMIKQ